MAAQIPPGQPSYRGHQVAPVDSKKKNDPTEASIHGAASSSLDRASKYANMIAAKFPNLHTAVRVKEVKKHKVSKAFSFSIYGKK